MTTFQRRKHQRYGLSMPAEILIPGSSKIPEGLSCQVVELSRHGVRLEVALGIEQQHSLMQLRMAPPDSPSITASLELLHRESSGHAAFRYGGKLKFTSEEARRRMHAFLRTVGEDKAAERRIGDRREAADAKPSGMPEGKNGSERRRDDRRRRFGIFDHCMSFATRLPDWKSTYTYYRHSESTRPARTSFNGQELISFSSKDYLGLAHHPRVKAAAAKAIERYGTTTWSRPLNGTFELLRELESELASFKGKQAALVFTGGYVANITILTALLGKGDRAFLDEKVHASIVDGCIASGVKMIVFAHNSEKDLERKLSRFRQDRSLIIVDGVYSIEGDIVNLPGIKALADSYRVPLMVDDAHGIGVMGPNGSGTSEHFGLKGKIDIEVGSFGASLAGMGGFIACDEAVRDYLVHFCDGILYTTNLPPATVAGVLEALRIIKTEPSLRETLWSNVRRFRGGLEKLGFNVGPSQSAVMTIEIGNERLTDDTVKLLETRGIAVNTFRRPMVRRGGAKLRMSVTAAHSEADIDRALEVFSWIKPTLDARIAELTKSL